MSLIEYLKSFREALGRAEAFGYTESVEAKEEVRPNRQGALKARIVFVNGSVLDVREYIDGRYGIEKVSYAYQYQDRDGDLIFRYDNAAHRPKLGFVDHRHARDGSVVETSPPDVREVIEEIVGSL
jgi:hypothetical protein